MNRLFYILMIATLSFGLVACKPEQPSRFAVAGVDNERTVEKVLTKLQKAVAEDDRKTVVSMIRYPFATYDLGEKIKDYPTPEDVLADYDLLFNQEVKDAIASANMDNIFANQEGIMLGQGEIWFNNASGELKINAVQNIN